MGLSLSFKSTRQEYPILSQSKKTQSIRGHMSRKLCISFVAKLMCCDKTLAEEFWVTHATLHRLRQGKSVIYSLNDPCHVETGLIDHFLSTMKLGVCLSVLSCLNRLTYYRQVLSKTWQFQVHKISLFVCDQWVFAAKAFNVVKEQSLKPFITVW